MLTVLAGGVGAARFLRGLVRAVDARELTVVVNVGDDLQVHGLRVCPDIDTIVYTLAGAVDDDRGWGRDDETFHAAEELERYGAPTWFALGDRDLATHLVRTQQLRSGLSLSQATARMAASWGLELAIVPATDDPVATRIHTTDGRDLHFQEYWVRERARPEVEHVELAGGRNATPAPGVLDAIRDADAILVCPSNPVVSIGTILAIPGIHDALSKAAAPVVGVSPIVGGEVVRGMAHRLLPAVGAEVSAAGVAELYTDWLDGWVIDRADAELADGIAASGVEVVVTDTMMRDVEVARSLAAKTIDLADRIGRRT